MYVMLTGVKPFTDRKGTQVVVSALEALET
jgi:hypothetical protein